MIASIFAKVIPRFSCEALKFCNIITRALHSPQRTCDSIFANTFLETGDVLVECIEQCLLLAAESLIGIAYHLCRDESFTVWQVLVVLDDLSLDVVEVTVNLQCLLAASLGTVLCRGKANKSFIYGHSALIFENCSLVTSFFRNFATIFFIPPDTLWKN